MTYCWRPTDKELKEQVDIELEMRAHDERLIDDLRAEVVKLTDAIIIIEKAYSMRAADVWVHKNLSPSEYLNNEISRALESCGR